MAAQLSDALSHARRHCEAAFPNEGVGALLHTPEGWRFRPLRNVADAAHAADPLSFPRTARTSFVIDPAQWMALERAALGLEVCLVHSHVDAPALLSAWDHASLAIDGRPLLPGLWLVVLSVTAGRCVAETHWRMTDGRFRQCL